MKYAPKKVFVLESGNYKELNYEEFCSLKENDVSYADKFFIPLHGILMEVTEETYRDFYKSQRRQKYIDERSVGNSNPPIVSCEIYQAAKELQKARKNPRSKNKHIYPLSGVIRCHDCGMTFRRQIVKGIAYWLCSNKAANMTDCRPLRLKETAVYETFTMLVQKLADNRKTLLGDLIRQAEAMQNRTSDNIDVIRRIDKEIADLAAQNLIIARLHTNGVLNAAEFSAQSSEINNKISTLRTKRRQKLSDDENDAWLDTLNHLKCSQIGK